MVGIIDHQVFTVDIKQQIKQTFEPRYEKTSLRGFQPGPTRTGLYSHRRLLEARNFVYRK